MAADGGLVLNLPIPPSVNRMTAKLGNRSTSVQHWIKLADGYVIADRLNNKKIDGPCIVTITWPGCDFGKYDADNRVKPLLDYLQRIAIIGNDKCCYRVSAGFGREVGDVERDWCRVEIQPRGW